MRRRSGGRVAMVALCAGVALGAGASPAAAGKKNDPPPRVYTSTNDPEGNAVVMYSRRKDGKIIEERSFRTGGTGRPSIAIGYPFTESQGAVTLSDDGRHLFVVNHGSDTVTSFRVTQRGLDRQSIVPSDGVGPLSVTVSPNGRLAYVLNEGNPANISGFTVNRRGRMRPLSDSTVPLAYPNGAPAQVSFDQTGRVLVVSDRQSGPGSAPDFLESFRVAGNGRATALPPTPSNGSSPFGFAFTESNVLVMTNPDNDNLNTSTVSSYTTARDGTLTPVDSEAVGQTATCWVVITPDQRFAIVSNTVSFSLSVYRVQSNGQMTPAMDGRPSAVNVEGAPLDLDLSRDGRTLYVLNTDPRVIFNDPAARMDVELFRVRGNDLRSLGSVSVLPDSTSGIAAW